MAASATSIPNLLTYGRIAAVPAVVACFYADGLWGRWLALAIFSLAAITDYFDGYLARLWNEQSSLGRMLDPIADKLLVAATLLMLAADQTLGWVSIIAAVIIMCREVLVSGLREYLAEAHVTVSVSQLAKWKTTMQLVAIGFLIAGPAGEVVLPWTIEIGTVLLWIAAALTLYTGLDYLRGASRHLTD